MKTTYLRIRHAAHYLYQHPWKGHDLEQWDVTDPVGRTPVRSPEIPADAEHQMGYRDGAGVQHWIYVRRAPFGEGTCERCPHDAPCPDDGIDDDIPNTPEERYEDLLDAREDT